MATGKVKWFNHEIGAGFIRTEDGDNVFFRFSAVHKNGSEMILRGQCVSFELVKDLKSISRTAASVKIVAHQQ